MGKHENRGLAPIARTRPGEGALIDIARRTSLSPDGSNITAVEVDLSSAPVPERRFLADTAWVDYRAGLVRLMFGQQRVDRGDLRALVVLCFTIEDLRHFLGTSKALVENLKAYLGNSSTPTEELEPVTAEPPQAVSMFANIMAVAYAANQASIDFYHASAWALHQLRNAQNLKLALEPMVRVILTSSLLFALLGKLEAVQSQFSIETKVA